MSVACTYSEGVESELGKADGNLLEEAKSTTNAHYVEAPAAAAPSEWMCRGAWDGRGRALARRPQQE